MFKPHLSTSRAMRIGGSITCNWFAEANEKPTEFECNKYFKDIITDSISCIKKGIKCYLFTQEQVSVLKKEIIKVKTKNTFMVKELDDRFLIIPRAKRGLK
jgi:hypothetical protein